MGALGQIEGFSSSINLLIIMSLITGNFFNINDVFEDSYCS